MTKAYLEASEVQDLEKAANNLRDKLLIRLLFRLGCRVSEALSLEVEDIDPKRDTVTIQHLKARIKLSCPRCNARLGKATVSVLNVGRRLKTQWSRSKSTVE